MIQTMTTKNSSGQSGSPGTTTAVLSTATCAAALNVPEVFVNRLVANGGLPGTVVGRGSCLVLPDDLAKYVKSGAPNLTPPTMRGGWFDPNETYPADSLPSQIISAVESQWPEAAAVQNKFDTDQQTNYIIQIKAADVAALIKAPVPKPILPNQPKSRFASMGELYMAKVWRDAVAKELGNGNQSGMLYGSPTEYRSTLDSTWGTLMKRSISRTKTYAPTKKIAAHGTEIVSVQLALPLSSLMTYVDKNNLEALTF